MMKIELEKGEEEGRKVSFFLFLEFFSLPFLINTDEFFEIAAKTNRGEQPKLPIKIIP